jgi:hypothetical protein
MDWFTQLQEAFERSPKEGEQLARHLAAKSDPEAQALAAWATACFGPDHLLSDAALWAESAAEQRPDDPEILHTLLWVYASQEDWPKVSGALIRYLALRDSTSFTEEERDDLTNLFQKALAANSLQAVQQTLQAHGQWSIELEKNRKDAEGQRRREKQKAE